MSASPDDPNGYWLALDGILKQVSKVIDDKFESNPAHCMAIASLSKESFQNTWSPPTNEPYGVRISNSFGPIDSMIPEWWAQESLSIFEGSTLPVPIFHKDDPRGWQYENIMNGAYSISAYARRGMSALTPDQERVYILYRDQLLTGGDSLMRGVLADVLSEYGQEAAAQYLRQHQDPVSDREIIDAINATLEYRDATNRSNRGVPTVPVLQDGHDSTDRAVDQS